MARPAVSPIIVLTTVAGREEADRLARALVEGRLAACVARFPVRSTYRWDGSVEEAEEWQLMVKTTSDMRAALEEEIKRTGGYELPEFVVIGEGVEASAGYLEWMIESCHPAS